MKRIKKIGPGSFFEKRAGLLVCALILCACTEESARFDSHFKKIKQHSHSSLPTRPFFKKIGFKPMQLFRDPFNGSFKHQPLFSLKQLSFKGLLKEENHLVALIQQPNKQIIVVQVGDKVGAEQAQVILIQEKFLQVQVDKTIQKINME